MKKFLGLIIVSSLILSFNACDNNDDEQTEPTLQEQLTIGEWMVTHLQEDNNGMYTNRDLNEEDTYFITFTETSYSMYETENGVSTYEENGTYTVVDDNVITTMHPNLGAMTFVAQLNQGGDELVLTQPLQILLGLDDDDIRYWVWTLELYTE
ncbi:lipocalin family protein [Winogradskyella sp. Asnod2-B02-A]|uniref:lipocalin family protein n=1 Tax=Winogradskyella sp. Asnod2-B02-A TaxID=3160583 RepID=UPI00386FAC14